MKFAEYTSSLDALPVPEWIIAERYMYCDNFINDYTKTRHFDLLAFVKTSLSQIICTSFHKKDIRFFRMSFLLLLLFFGKFEASKVSLQAAWQSILPDRNMAVPQYQIP